MTSKEQSSVPLGLNALLGVHLRYGECMRLIEECTKAGDCNRISPIFSRVSFLDLCWLVKRTDEGQIHMFFFGGVLLWDEQ